MSYEAERQRPGLSFAGRVSKGAHLVRPAQYGIPPRAGHALFGTDSPSGQEAKLGRPRRQALPA